MPSLRGRLWSSEPIDSALAGAACGATVADAAAVLHSGSDAGAVAAAADADAWPVACRWALCSSAPVTGCAANTLGAAATQGELAV